MTEFFYAIIAIEHDFLMHLDLLGPSRDVKTLAFHARIVNTSLGAQQMLRHRKSACTSAQSDQCLCFSLLR